CLGGPDAVAIAQALDALSERGTSFTLAVHDKYGHNIAIRGRAVGGMAAVWLEEIAEVKSLSPDFQSVLDALPIPVWLRDKTLSLLWSNKAYATAAGAPDVTSAVA